MMTTRVLRMSPGQRAQLIGDSLYGRPGEICGILGGLNMTVEGIFPVRNVSSQPERSFFMDPQSLFGALDALDRRGWQLLAVYHSHPPGARTDPSQSDLAQASYPGSLQVIVVPGEGGQEGSVRAFAVENGRAAEVQIITVGPPDA